MTSKLYKTSRDKKVLVDPRTRKKIFHSVVIVHVLIISTILLWYLVVDLFRPKRPQIITVSLYTPPANPGPPAYTPPAAKKKTKTTVKKPKKKIKPKKKWKAAKKIKISKNIVYVKPKVRAKPRPRVKPMSKQKLLDFLNQKQVKIRSNTSSTGPVQSYENSVGAYLYQLWDTPDKSALGKRRPEVKIMLNIAADGRLLGAEILKPSGVGAMDESVKKLLRKIKYLPAPGNGSKKIILILEVIE